MERAVEEMPVEGFGKPSFEGEVLNESPTPSPSPSPTTSPLQSLPPVPTTDPEAERNQDARTAQPVAYLVASPSAAPSAGRRVSMAADRRRRITLFLLGFAAVGLAAGYALKAPCISGDWNDGKQYRRLCYSDIVPLYGARGLSEGRFPYLDSTAETRAAHQDVEYPAGTGLYFGVVAKTTTTLVSFFNANAVGLALMGLATAWALSAMARDRETRAPVRARTAADPVRVPQLGSAGRRLRDARPLRVLARSRRLDGFAARARRSDEALSGVPPAGSRAGGVATRREAAVADGRRIRARCGGVERPAVDRELRRLEVPVGFPEQPGAELRDRMVHGVPSCPSRLLRARHLVSDLRERGVRASLLDRHRACSSPSSPGANVRGRTRSASGSSSCSC